MALSFVQRNSRVKRLTLGAVVGPQSARIVPLDLHGEGCVVDKKRRGGDPNVPNRIGAARESAEISQEVLAERLGWSEATISKIENGRQAVTLSQLVEIATVLDVPVSRLLDPSHIADVHMPVEAVPLVSASTVASLKREAIQRLRHDWSGETALVACKEPRAFAIRPPCPGMSRTIQADACVLVDPDDTALADKRIYLIRHEKKVMLRRFRGGPVERFVAEGGDQIDDLFLQATPGIEVLGRVVRVFFEP